MSDFFKPLRRKIGVIWLGLACLFAVGWVRSRVCLDYVPILLTNKTTIAVVSTDTHFYTGITQLKDSPTNASRFAWFTTPKQTIEQTLAIDPKEIGIDLRCCGIGLLTTNDDRGGSLLCVAPYYSVVLPLTLLSAWMLLSRPRAPKSS